MIESTLYDTIVLLVENPVWEVTRHAAPMPMLIRGGVWDRVEDPLESVQRNVELGVAGGLGDY